MIYAQTLDRLRAAAASLLEALAGVEAQAVPFTAPIDDAGLVSWGADPPRRHQLSRWQGTSWRRWITDRLAVSLLIANGPADNSPIEPWQFALARIGLEGVNTETWVPENVEWTVNL